MTDHEPSPAAAARDEAGLRSLLDALPGLVWVAGPDRRCVDFSEQWLRFRGRSLAEEIGDGWSEGLHPDDRERVVRAYELAFDARDRFEAEYRMRRADGAYRWLLDAGHPWHGRDGTFLGYVGVCIDITDRRHSEDDVEDLRLAVENAMTGVSRLDADGRFTLVREGYARMLGYEPEELLGVSWEVAVPESHRPAAEEAYRQMLEEGRAEAELRGRRKDGSEFWKQLLLVRVRDEQGRHAGHYCFMRDITDRVEAEHERAELEAELWRARKLEAVGTLASGVAHDFNNALTAVGGFSQMAELSLPEGHPAREHLRDVQRAVEQASGVCRSLLTFSKTAPSRREPTDLNELVRSAAHTLRPLLPASVALELRLDDGEPWIEADADRLRQVVVNLVVNARDALPDGGRIVVRTGAHEGRAELEVSDDGRGMDHEVLTSAFDPFFTTKPREEGTGLGLAIVHGIVTEHGGEVRADSSLGRGTTVVASFERVPPLSSTVPEPEPATDPGAPGAGSGTLLVAEDNEAIRQLLHQFLTASGYSVLVARDGAETMEVVERHEDIDLVLLDLDLPEKPGWVCLAEIRARRPELPIVVVSGHGARAVSAEDCAAYLAKPFEFGEVVETVRRTLDSPDA